MGSNATDRKTRVLVVDDSESMVAILLAAMKNDEHLEVVGVGRDGEEAVELTAILKPDVITMDIVMPRLDGIGAIRRIMSTTPTPIVVVAALSSAQVSFDAINAGALAVVEKPKAIQEASGQATLAKLFETLKIMSAVKVVKLRLGLTRGASLDGARRGEPGTPPSAAPAGFEAAPSRKKSATRDIGGPRDPRIVAIAASTGGPPALVKVLRDLPADYPLPILLVQHIARGFGSGFVHWLNGMIQLSVVQAKYGDEPRAGVIYVSPDDQHLVLGMNGRIVLSNALPVASHRPSATHLFQSVGQSIKQDSVAIVLTGMGADGAEGLVSLKRAGGFCIAQDEASCVVFGMPKAAIDLNVVDRVMNLEQIATYLQLLGEEKRASRTA